MFVPKRLTEETQKIMNGLIKQAWQWYICLLYELC